MINARFEIGGSVDFVLFLQHFRSASSGGKLSESPFDIRLRTSGSFRKSEKISDEASEKLNSKRELSVDTGETTNESLPKPTSATTPMALAKNESFKPGSADIQIKQADVSDKAGELVKTPAATSVKPFEPPMKTAESSVKAADPLVATREKSVPNVELAAVASNNKTSTNLQKTNGDLYSILLLYKQNPKKFEDAFFAESFVPTSDGVSALDEKLHLTVSGIEKALTSAAPSLESNVKVAFQVLIDKFIQPPSPLFFSPHPDRWRWNNSLKIKLSFVRTC